VENGRRGQTRWKKENNLQAGQRAIFPQTNFALGGEGQHSGREWNREKTKVSEPRYTLFMWGVTWGQGTQAKGLYAFPWKRTGSLSHREILPIQPNSYNIQRCYKHWASSSREGSRPGRAGFWGAGNTIVLKESLEKKSLINCPLK